MPAGSEPGGTVALPARFRPLGIRLAAVGLGVALAVVLVAIWYAFSAETRAAFTGLQRLTLVGFGVAMVLVGYALGRSRVDAREDGLLAVNGFRSHFYPWEQVARITLRDGAPWSLLELTDGTTAPAMGIQGSDGRRAVEQVKRLRAIQRSVGSRPGD